MKLQELLNNNPQLKDIEVEGFCKVRNGARKEDNILNYYEMLLSSGVLINENLIITTETIYR